MTSSAIKALAAVNGAHDSELSLLFRLGISPIPREIFTVGNRNIQMRAEAHPSAGPALVDSIAFRIVSVSLLFALRTERND